MATVEQWETRDELESEPTKVKEAGAYTASSFKASTMEVAVFLNGGFRGVAPQGDDGPKLSCKVGDILTVKGTGQGGRAAGSWRFTGS
ncbi:hypothetical protein [Thalassococcus sp. S3]|uniref:hypothetical protein n=1 Tax=Thalassococcus sp. S3 TaxID=2017482 RepID=UPI00102441DA|nr:hypothetical protein [Thalassococcus sp. S3]QBF32526.1 hypothetical protein CFI11_15060 [Thalassococcus sp. S3]